MTSREAIATKTLFSKGIKVRVKTKCAPKLKEEKNLTLIAFLYTVYLIFLKMLESSERYFSKCQRTIFLYTCFSSQDVSYRTSQKKWSDRFLPVL